MEAVGFGASVLTFVAAAVSVSKSIHDILSAIKDGPEIIGFLNSEISQLEAILQRLLQVASSIAEPTDRPELEHLVKRCKDDLVGFEVKLRQLDVSGADGRRGRLWRKLKICLEEKDLAQIRHVVRWHVHLLTLHLVIVQTRQLPVLTDILPALQQIRQGVTALQLSNKTAATTQVDSSGLSLRATEPDDVQSHLSQQAALGDTIARLMNLLERRPCIVESEDSKEIVQDLERLLQFVQNEAPSEKSGRLDGGKGEDVSSEVKLLTSLIVPAPSLRINQNAPTGSYKATTSQLAVFQERKRKELHINDAVITVATTKRREKLLSGSEDTSTNEPCGRGFCGSLTLKSRTKKKMLTLHVQQGQLLFDRFTSLLPRVMVCNILPGSSKVFKVASNGSVEDLMRLIVENKASLDDRDEDGWSLLHYAIGNLATTKFLIQQGLDVTEVANNKYNPRRGQTNPLTIAYDYRHDVVFSELLLCAGADPTASLEGQNSLFLSMAYQTDIKARSIFHRTLCISPFVFPQNPYVRGDLLSGFCQAWAKLPGDELDPEQERKTLDLSIHRGYKIASCIEMTMSLHGFFLSCKRSLSKVLERRDLLLYLISRGSNTCSFVIEGLEASFLAYRKICKPCSISQSSLMGDIWDNILDIHGYDILAFRKTYPRMASYKNGYTREIFEQLWTGREERCPYWNDEPWPNVLKDGLHPNYESESGQGLCMWCRLCFYGTEPCNQCGICLLTYQYSCHQNSDPDHDHDDKCPRIRVGYLEECEKCGCFEFRPKAGPDSCLGEGISDCIDSSRSGYESGFRQSPLHNKVTECCYCRFEEVSSDDESLGEIGL